MSVRVLHVVLDLDYGGLQKMIADLIRGMDRGRFESHVVALKRLGPFASGLEHFATVHPVIPRSRWSFFHPAQLIAMMRRVNPDIVHTHSGAWYKGTLAARRAGVGHLIHTDHGRLLGESRLDVAVERLAAGHTDDIVAVSAPLAQRLATLFPRQASRIRIVPNGVDTDQFHPQDSRAARAAVGLPAEALVIGSIGRLDSIKGYDIMIRAFASLLRGWTSDLKPILVIAGDGPEQAPLQQLVTELGVARHVRLLGWRDDPLTLLNAFDVFTLASRSEGTSIGLLEAMSAGRCPVVTDVGGNRAVLGVQLEHRLVPPEDPEALAVAWRAALEGETERRRDEHAARARVLGSYGLNGMVEAYEALYAAPASSGRRT